MARVTMKVVGRRLNGMAIGDTFSATEAQAAALEEAGHAERLSRTVRAMKAERAPAAKKATRTYKRRDMKAEG